MASLITHPVVPLALGAVLGAKLVTGRMLLAAVVATVIADFDVIAFNFGIPYASAFGHRGFTHSVTFALLLSVLAASYARTLSGRPAVVFVFVLIAALSHPVLDALTNGGLGVALLWPFSDARFFAPWQPIEVSPIGLERFISHGGLRVLWSEFLWVWLPAATLAAVGAFCRKRFL